MYVQKWLIIKKLAKTHILPIYMNKAHATYPQKHFF